MSSSEPDSTDAKLEAATRASMKGDLQAMGKLVELTHLRLRGFLRTICADSAAIDDLAQETYVTAFRKIHQLDAPESVMAFLLGIARNHVRNHVRKAGRRAAIEHDHLEEITERLVTRLDGGDFVESTDMGEALSHCLKKLTTAERDLIHRRYAMELSSVDLSKSTGESRSAIRTRLMRLRERLRTCVREQLSLAGIASIRYPSSSQ